jgi:hypothetical protein
MKTAALEVWVDDPDILICAVTTRLLNSALETYNRGALNKLSIHAVTPHRRRIPIYLPRLVQSKWLSLPRPSQNLPPLAIVTSSRDNTFTRRERKIEPLLGYCHLSDLATRIASFASNLTRPVSVTSHSPPKFVDARRHSRIDDIDIVRIGDECLELTQLLTTLEPTAFQKVLSDLQVARVRVP